MNCPCCNNRLEFDDGAFCKTCMATAAEKNRKQLQALTELDEYLRLWDFYGLDDPLAHSVAQWGHFPFPAGVDVKRDGSGNVTEILVTTSGRSSGWRALKPPELDSFLASMRR